MKAVIAGAAVVLVTGMADGAPLEGKVAELAPLLGTWEVQGEWVGGPTVWARAHYGPGLNGRSVEGRLLVKDGDGAPYERYFSVFTHDDARNAWVAHTFHRDGRATRMDVDWRDGVLLTEWTEGDHSFRDRSELLGDGRMRWTVDVATAGTGDFQNVMNATWIQREEDFMPHPIDSNLFTADAVTTSFVKEATIRAPVEDVYRAWTNGEAFAAAYEPDRKALRANIDLAIGGRYEWLWDGETGSNGCQVLSFIPNRMVSFSWNAPPEQPDSRAQRTWVVVEFSPTDDGTHCRLTHLGFGEAEHWAETREYFANAWPYVLEQFRKNLEAAAAPPAGR
ncbi:MAG: hypothetical protein DHS20C21_16120 [Gemmatimonadota bacterium]|nr:MAG: hypothetical protein DHS20C21_16120 [Gemmatimonadota bacterium]